MKSGKKYFTVDAYIANIFHPKSGEVLSKQERKYFWKQFTVVALDASEALTKVGRQVSASECSAESYNFV